jgi:hypothetical protein
MPSEKDVNRFELKRYIPADVRREIRKSSGFGCVICGGGLYEYEHVDPEFKDAKEHLAHCITLLCPGCHGKVTKGTWSKEKVKRHMASPAALQQGYAKDIYDLCGGHPFIKFGGMTLRNCRIPLRIFGKDILRIDPPEEAGGTFLLSGNLCDEFGRPTLVIEKNEWKAASDSWDVTTEGAALEIRNGPGDIVLRLVASPPDGLTIERLKMCFGPVEIFASADILKIEGPLGGGTFSNCIADNSHVGMELFPLKREGFRVNPWLSPAAKMVQFQILHGNNWLPHYMQSLNQPF